MTPRSSTAPVLARSARKGFALILLLVFIVLLSGLIIAFLNLSLSDTVVSGSSANQVKVSIFAQGALNTIVGDLKQEIADGSKPPSVASGSQFSANGTNIDLYFPNNNQTAVPYRVGNPSLTLLPNLLKISTHTQPLYPGAPNYNSQGVSRAANASTTNSSLNGRSISLARWNSAFLLPKQTPTSATDATPIAAFTAPDWILVARDGSNPTSLSTNVIGRYAYAIYDEGGLLDMNVAGYPSDSANSAAYQSALAYHSALASATLTNSIGLTQAQVDAVVGWRNTASAQPSGSFPSYAFRDASATNYFNSVNLTTNGFLHVAGSGAPVYSHQSDRQFTSRRELMNLLLATAGNDSTRAQIQNSLQYLGTFSRDVSQPSYVPDPARPTIASDNGGNNGAGNDNVINPSFLTVRVKAPFTRSDGITQAVIGEPLVKKRFALNRLAWITYEGPSAGVSSSDPIITQMEALGISSQLIQQGTAANIQAYFGLTWDGGNKRWQYNVHASSSGTGAIATLSDVAGQNREPDFFELLKTAICAGAIGKGATNPAGMDYEIYQYSQDISIDYQIVQIAANIEDQFDTDGFPTRILFQGKELDGVENLPYFYRVRGATIQAVSPNPLPAIASDYSGHGAPAEPSSTPPALTDPGLYFAILEPELWNPHDQNGSMGNPRPTSFRFVALSNPPGGVPSPGSTMVIETESGLSYMASPSVTTATPGGLAQTGGAKYQPSTAYNPTTLPYYHDNPLPLTAANTEMDFNVTSAAMFREPTLLLTPGLPTGSNLRITSSNLIFTKAASLAPAETGAIMAGQGINPVVSNSGHPVIGIYLGMGPLRWVVNLGSNPSSWLNGYQYWTLSAYDSSRLTLTPSTSFTFQVQYENPAGSGNWIPYDTKFAPPLDGLSTFLKSRVTGTYNPDGAIEYLVPDEPYGHVMDPRTSRFGMQVGWAGNVAQTVPSPLAVSSTSRGGFITGNLMLPSERPDASSGNGSSYWISSSGAVAGTPADGSFSGMPFVNGWYPTYLQTETIYSRIGLFSQNSTAIKDDAQLFSGGGVYGTPDPLPQYYTDPDGVVRRAMGGYALGPGSAATTGLPMAATLAAGTAALNKAQTQSRPLILNRPFRSVAELGYVFSGTPWKNLDFFSPESGYSPLLDAFCINDTSDPNALVAGKVDLNTQQVPVLQAILSGAYQDENNYNPSGTPTGASAPVAITPAEATAIAQALVTRTASTAAGEGPLGNISELVGKYGGTRVASPGGVFPHNVDGQYSYTGFSNDLGSILAANDSTLTSAYVERFRESAVRALSSAGTTRVWNLMIDVVAQTGRYPASAKSPDDFIVEGEQRCWLHIAIDRYTGQVLDRTLEIVKE